MSYGNTLQLWSVTKQKKILDMQGSEADIRHIIISPDNRFLVTASGKRTMQLWTFLEEKAREELQENTDEILAIDYAHSDKLKCGYLASASKDGKVNIWKYS